MAHCPVLAIYRNDNIRPYADTLAKRNIKRGPWLNKGGICVYFICVFNAHNLNT